MAKRELKWVRVEKRARKIAARKMGLVKDPDGEKLPDDLWRQAVPLAMIELFDEAQGR